MCFCVSQSSKITLRLLTTTLKVKSVCSTQRGWCAQTCQDKPRTAVLSLSSCHGLCTFPLQRNLPQLPAWHDLTWLLCFFSLLEAYTTADYAVLKTFLKLLWYLHCWCVCAMLKIDYDHLTLRPLWGVRDWSGRAAEATGSCIIVCEVVQQQTVPCGCKNEPTGWRLSEKTQTDSSGEILYHLPRLNSFSLHAHGNTAKQHNKSRLTDIGCILKILETFFFEFR